MSGTPAVFASSALSFSKNDRSWWALPTAATLSLMFKLHLFTVAGSALLYYGFFHLNMGLFNALELHSGANWIFLPAGLRLLCTLLFATGGAVGLLVASVVISLDSYGEMGWITNIGSALISAGAPYLVYRLALYRGMPATLEQLTATRLLQLSVIYALASAGLHSLWYVLRGVFDDVPTSFATMFTGDLIGTVIMLYAMKMLLAAARRLRGAP